MQKFNEISREHCLHFHESVMLLCAIWWYYKQNKVSFKILWLTYRRQIRFVENMRLFRFHACSIFLGIRFLENTYIYSLVISILTAQDLEERERQLKASLCENLLGLRHSNVLIQNFQKQRAKAMLELTRNRLRVVKGFLTWLCHHEKHITRIDLN